MDRHPQQIKRKRQDKNRRERNIKNLSRLKTLIKNVLSSKDTKEAEPLYKDTVSYLDKMAQSGLIHKNTASRRKSQITHYYNSLSKS
jgi:small subunit ribosomal protein S20